MLAFDTIRCPIEEVDRIPCGDLLSDTTVLPSPPDIPDCNDAITTLPGVSVFSSDGSINVTQIGTTVNMTLPDIGDAICVPVISAVNWAACTYDVVYLHVGANGLITINDTPC